MVCTRLVQGVLMRLEFALAVVQQLAKVVPILGVCLGHQIIAQAVGATVVEAQEPMHGKTSLISHDGRGIYDGLPAILM